ncbi:hypothetical protein OHB39_36370 [Streptomyces sp. NBC_00047]|uniref:hypothetical protein n=1 Tax=Streptomyces sp. NBC_00047 TaxID=2975627 RepID=UPI00224ED1E6|nr:hypothetical protein [Streptomyces sp. NBC_00047]MCX5612989.1 hypothetical protein [Streptomyces sp. NBC_00047]
MNTETTTAIVAGLSAMGGAGLAGWLTVRAAGRQAAGAVEAGLAQGAGAYLGALDTARRSAQREAYARLITVAHEYHESVKPVLYFAQALGTQQPPMNAATRQRLEEQVDAVSNTRQVRAAVAHVVLEGPGEIAKAAERLGAAAHGVEYALKAATHQVLTHPTPRDYYERHEQLLAEVSRFGQAASGLLNRRDQGPGPSRPSPAP